MCAIDMRVWHMTLRVPAIGRWPKRSICKTASPQMLAKGRPWNIFLSRTKAEYRSARNALLDAEMALRRQLEAVAAQRRSLPPGGEVPEDYVFERIGANERPEPVRLSELFGDHPSILLYSFTGRSATSPAPAAPTRSTAATAASFTLTSASRPMSSPNRQSRDCRRWHANAAGAT